MDDNVHPHHVHTVVVVQRTQTQVHMTRGRDVWYHSLINDERPYCPPESMDSEDTLFYLYTSGSTGKPKGLVHTTAGYLLYAAITAKFNFDLRENVFMLVLLMLDGFWS